MSKSRYQIAKDLRYEKISQALTLLDEIETNAVGVETIKAIKMLLLKIN